jgi:hypothetical protein
MDFLVRPIRSADGVANHPTPTIQCSRHKSRIESGPKNGQKSMDKSIDKSIDESYCHPVRSVPFGMRSNQVDQIKSVEQHTAARRSI